VFQDPPGVKNPCLIAQVLWKRTEIRYRLIGYQTVG
jgi:hypothetical protein